MGERRIENWYSWFHQEERCVFSNALVVVSIWDIHSAIALQWRWAGGEPAIDLELRENVHISVHGVRFESAL